MGVTERRATAAAILLGYTLLSALFALVPDTGFQGLLGAFGLLYAVAFSGVYTRAFWGRWFAHGLGSWGLMAGAVLMLTTGPGVFLISIVATHAALTLLLSGDAIAAEFDGRTDWRQRYNLSERGARTVGSLVNNLGALLPCIAFYALFPRGGTATPLMAFALAAAGTVGVLRMRTWGLLALAASGTTLVVSTWGHVEHVVGHIVGWLLTLTLLPFVVPMVRFVRAK